MSSSTVSMPIWAPGQRPNPPSSRARTSGIRMRDSIVCGGFGQCPLVRPRSFLHTPCSRHGWCTRGGTVNNGDLGLKAGEAFTRALRPNHHGSANEMKIFVAAEGDGAEGRNRTGTSRWGQGILSPLRLPVPPPPHTQAKGIPGRFLFLPE